MSAERKPERVPPPAPKVVIRYAPDDGAADRLAEALARLLDEPDDSASFLRRNGVG